MMSSLPQGFAELEPFVEAWSGDTAAARAAIRDAAEQEDAQAFYACAQSHLERGLEYLDGKPLAEHDEADIRLMRLFLALAHVALAIEVQGKDEPVHSTLRRYMRLTTAPADK